MTATHTPTPTLIHKEALDALITHIQKHRFIVRDLGTTLEHLHMICVEGGKPSLTPDYFELKEQLGEANDYILYMKPLYSFSMTARTKEWAGLERYDPYLDMPRFPKSTLLAAELHTWESYSNLQYAKANSIRLQDIIMALQRMPTHELGF